MVNDLAEDIQKVPRLAKLQPWAIETLARFQAGQVHTNGGPSWYWKGPAVKLAQQERPSFIKEQWGETNKWGEEWPEIYVLLSDSSVPESIAVVWGMYGVVIGPREYPAQTNAWYAHDYAEAMPGVYVFHEDK